VDLTERPGDFWRYCPKCGAESIQVVGVKLVSCGNCGFEFYRNAATAAAALIADNRGRLMVVVRAREPKKGTWDLPGGFTDPGESAEESLHREIREELGLEIASMQYLCSYPNTYDFKDVRYATVDLGFVCRVDDVAAATVCPREVAELLFVPPEELEPSRFGFESVRKIVQRYREVCERPQNADSRAPL